MRYKIGIVIFMFFLFASLYSDVVKYRINGYVESYYPKYPEYYLGEPVMGLKVNVEFFNFFKGLGCGGSAQITAKSYDKYFQDRRVYDAYIHSFSNFRKDDSYFIYGFLGGIKCSELKYEDHITHLDNEVRMIRPLLGFHFSTHVWGFSILWTQAENLKPCLGTEVKYRSTSGVFFQIGRYYRGPVSGVKADISFLIGYEFFK